MNGAVVGFLVVASGSSPHAQTAPLETRQAAGRAEYRSIADADDPSVDARRVDNRFEIATSRIAAVTLLLSESSRASRSC